MEEILDKIADPKMRSQAEAVAHFHGYLSTGAFIGIQMLCIARSVLEAAEGEKLFVTCETYNCLPDPFQVLAGATIGNKGLKIVDHGKMAVTVTRRAPAGTEAKSVRVMLDPAKTAGYERLHAWFMKTEKVPHNEAVSILLLAGDRVYSWKVIEQEVPAKPRKRIAICERCNESFIQKDDETLCIACMEGKGDPISQCSSRC
jgi:formylmethanofuran dehydrogenase subunit E